MIDVEGGGVGPAPGAAVVARPVPLPPATDGVLVAGPASLVVSAPEFLGVLRPVPAGALEPVWLARTAPRRHGVPVLLPDATVVRAEDGQLVLREAADGAVRAAVPVPGLLGVAAGTGGELYHVSSRPRHGAVLSRWDPPGLSRWSYRIGAGGPVTVAVAGDTVLAGADGLLWGLGPDGATRWQADAGGFTRAGSARLGLAADLSGPPAGLPDGSVLAELTGPDAAGPYLFDAAAGTVAPLPGAATAAPPLAVVAVPGEPVRVAVCVPDPAGGTTDTAGGRGWLVLLLELDGTVRWSHPVPVRPHGLLADPAGQLYLVCGSDLDRWRRYRDWYDLSGEYFVRCLSGAGQVRWSWPAPAPLTYRPALGPDATVYAAGPGLLVALSAVPVGPVGRDLRRD